MGFSKSDIFKFSLMVVAYPLLPLVLNTLAPMFTGKYEQTLNHNILYSTKDYRFDEKANGSSSHIVIVKSGLTKSAPFYDPQSLDLNIKNKNGAKINNNIVTYNPNPNTDILPKKTNGIMVKSNDEFNLCGINAPSWSSIPFIFCSNKSSANWAADVKLGGKQISEIYLVTPGEIISFAFIVAILTLAMTWSVKRMKSSNNVADGEGLD